MRKRKKGDNIEETEKIDFKEKKKGIQSKESSRSSYERGSEDAYDYKRLEECSHVSKHYLLHHRENIMFEELEFGMKIRKNFKTALERHIGEVVMISREKAAGTTQRQSSIGV